MQSPANTSRESDLAEKTVLLLLAVGLNAVEYFIPRLPFFPWLKPGLANTVTLIWIIKYGTMDALLFSLVRTWIAGCYFGFSFVSLSLAASGGIAATLVMGLLWNMFGKRGLLGMVGLGVLGALFHNAGQLFAVYALMTTNTRVFFQLPLMALASILFGSVVGALALPVKNILDRKAGSKAAAMQSQQWLQQRVAMKEYLMAVGIITFSIALVFVTNTPALVTAAAVTALSVAMLLRRPLMLFITPLLRFWALFAFIGCIYLVFPYGTRLEHLSFLTHESVIATVQQWLRLWVWLELSFILMHFRFHVVLFSLFSKLFPNRQNTLTAGLLAFEYFPLVAQIGKQRGKGVFRRMVRHPLQSGKEGINGLYDEIVERMGRRREN
ncbi:MAG: Gx transporter family protein [Chitinispirillaceae bacterium]|nr:Gx transporter family protein [Chitinispirillaceae bacterium]